MKRTIVLLLLLWGWPVCAGHRYEIRATADPGAGIIGGAARLAYSNETPITLEAIPVVCSGQIARVTDAEGKPLRLEREPEAGYSKVILGRRLAPGKSVALELDFAQPFEVGSDGYRLVNGAWHPKAVTFRNGKFDPRQLQADDYDVTLTLPASEVVAASGRRVEESRTPDGRQRLRFRIDKITNFGVASSANFVESVREADGVEIRSYRLKGGEQWGPKLADYAARIIPFYRKLFGFYPHPSLVILPGSKTSTGGYPAASALIVVHDTLDRTSADFPEWITAHEIGHQYWGFDTVIDDGDYHNFPGLPLGIYTDRLYMEAQGRNTRDHRGFVSTYLRGVAEGYDTTIRRTREEMGKLPFDWNNIITHGKAYAVIQMLEELMGGKTFLKLARTLLERYRYRYLSFEDFQRTAEEVSGRKLDWFFRDWVDGNKVLSYAIEAVEPSGNEVKVRAKKTGTAGLPLPVELTTADGQPLRKNLAPEPESQAVVFAAPDAPLQVRLDPDGRFALHSPDAEHVWGKKAELVEVRMPEPVAWGTNTASLAVRNTDDRPHQILIHIQTTSLGVGGGGFGWQTEHTIGPGEEKRIDRDFNLRPYPGKARVRVQALDLTDPMTLGYRLHFLEFPLINRQANPLRVTPDLQKAFKWEKGEYPRLKLAEGERFALYYLEGDRWVEDRVPELLRERENAYETLRLKINPQFRERMALYLFPDAGSKRAYTGHVGAGWATGNVLVEIRNEKERLDPYHELVHVIAGPLGEPPALFQEGLAVYFQEGQKWNGYHVDAWSKAFAAAGLLWPIYRLGGFREIGPEETRPPIAYPQAGSLVKFLIDRHGLEKFLLAYKELGSKGARASREAGEQTFNKLFGASPLEVESAWLAALRESNMAPVPSAEIEKVKAGLR